MKPPLLPAVVALLCIFNLAGLTFIDLKYGTVAFQIVLVAAIIVVSFVVIWRFWLGSRLSRILVLITSGIAILNLLSIPSASPIQSVVIIGEALFAAFLFYWLFTAAVRQYFAAGPTI